MACVAPMRVTRGHAHLMPLETRKEGRVVREKVLGFGGIWQH